MSKVIKFFSLIVLFVFSFLFFLYWMFPTEAVKERVIREVEKNLGPGFEIAIHSMDIGLITGAKLHQVQLSKQVDGEIRPLFKSDKVSLRVGLLSTLFGSYKFSFDILSGKGEISGSARQTQGAWDLSLDLDDVDLKDLAIVQETTGLNLQSHIDGTLKLNFNPKQPLRTTGDLVVQFNECSMEKSDLKLGSFGSVPLPALVLAKGGSKFEAKVDKGAITLDAFDLKGGDLTVDLQGKVYLANDLSRYRMNLQGNFSMSPALAESLSLITALIEKQKGEDGAYPLSLTGPFAKPNIKVGNFVLPF